MSDLKSAIDWVEDNRQNPNINTPSRTPSYGNCTLHSMLGINPFVTIPDFVLKHSDALINDIHKHRFSAE
jgi:hypothetical protein